MFARSTRAKQTNCSRTDSKEVLLAAVETGYYRTPRESTLGEVAGALDIANATCSDTYCTDRGPTSSTGSSRSIWKFDSPTAKSLPTVVTWLTPGLNGFYSEQRVVREDDLTRRCHASAKASRCWSLADPSRIP